MRSDTRIETVLLALGTATMSGAVLYPLIQSAPYWGSGLGLVVAVGFIRAVRHDIRSIDSVQG